eukprot:7740971-Heterocapsa_arctica.AAC.1
MHRECTRLRGFLQNARAPRERERERGSSGDREMGARFKQDAQTFNHAGCYSRPPLGWYERIAT